jgi:hypothetical protein
VHADIFQDSSDLVFRDRSFWKASAIDYLEGHISQNMKRFNSGFPRASNVTSSAATAQPNLLSSVRFLNTKASESPLKEQDVAVLSVDAHSLHSGSPICVSAGPRLVDNGRLIAIAFEDLTLQVVAFNEGKMRLLNTTRFAPPQPEARQLVIDVVRRAR